MVMCRPGAAGRLRNAPQLAFVYRDRAEKERQLGGVGRAAELAFVYRDRAEKERQLGGVGAT
jgi:hypothetical protein